MTETEVQVLTARKDVVSKLLGKKDYRLALEASLDEPPNTSKDQSIKDGTAMCVLQVLNSISDNDILSTNDDSFINKINLTNYPHEKLNEKERYSELQQYRLN